MTTVSMHVNGVAVTRDVEDRQLLVHLLRDELGLDDAKAGCDTSNCGACLVSIDGDVVKACTVLTVQARGTRIVTLEGLAGAAPSFVDVAGALPAELFECGFCRAGVVLAVGELCARAAADGTTIEEPDVRAHLEGVLCRCATYDRVVDAVLGIEARQ